MSGLGDSSSAFVVDDAHFLDTSALIDVLRQGKTVGSGAFLPFAAVGELSIGGFRAVDHKREWKRIELALATAAGIVYPSIKTLLIYAELSAKMKAAGTPLPINDLWIAAVAIEWNLPLLANDKHFTLVPGLRLVSL